MTKTTTVEAKKNAAERREPYLDVLELKSIVLTPDNPRVIQPKSPDFLKLTASIKAIGVQVPIAVLMADGPAKGQIQFLCLAGERRIVASRAAKTKTIRAIIYVGLSPDEAFEITFTENYCRRDLTPAEQGRAVQTLMTRANGDTKVVADKLGQTERWVRLRVRLQDLTAEWKKAIEDPASDVFWMPSALLQLISRYPKVTQEAILERAGTYPEQFKNNALKDLEGWLDRMFMNRLTGAPWKLADHTLLESGSACSKCKNRSSVNTGLWDFHADEATLLKNDRCLDTDCWELKLRAFLTLQITIEKAEYPNLLIAVDASTSWARKEELAKALDCKVVDDFYYDKAKSSTPGALRALMIDGPKLGKTVWLKRNKQGLSCDEAKGAKKEGPTSLSDLKLKHERRRTALMLGDMTAAIGKAKCPGDDYLLTLASFLGVEAKADYSSTWRSYINWRSKLTSPVQVRAEIWKMTMPNMLDRIKYHGGISDKELGNMVEYATGFATVIGADIEAMRAKAVEELPDPKSWLKLTPDGRDKSTVRQDNVAAAKSAPAAKKKPAASKTTNKTAKAEGGRKGASTAKPKKGTKK